MEISNQNAGVVAALVAVIIALTKFLEKILGRKSAKEQRGIAQMVEHVAEIQKDTVSITKEILKNQESMNGKLAHIKDTVIRVDRRTEQIKDKQLAG